MKLVVLLALISFSHFIVLLTREDSFILGVVCEKVHGAAHKPESVGI